MTKLLYGRPPAVFDPPGVATQLSPLIPGSTLLGLVDTDHWGIALHIERVLPHIAARADPRPFPQLELLEAVFLTVRADLPP